MKLRTMLLFTALIHISTLATAQTTDFSPLPDEQQLPTAMHSKMKTLPHITVGPDRGDIRPGKRRSCRGNVFVIQIGRDNVGSGRSDVNPVPEIAVSGLDVFAVGG